MELIKEICNQYVRYGYYLGGKKNDYNFVPHREDGPAEIWRNGKSLIYYYHGMLHRLDGPAFDFGGGFTKNLYYVEDILYLPSEYEDAVKRFRFKLLCK